jgi:hypothetical protein
MRRKSCRTDGSELWCGLESALSEIIDELDATEQGRVSDAH